MSLFDKLQANSREKLDAEIARGQQFLAANKLAEGITETQTGLQYQVIVQGNGDKPLANSRVTTHYTGSTTDGKVFDSSVERGQPLSFGLNQVISGWTEGLQLMPVGSKYRFFIPHTLGYGERGAGAAIPGGAALIFDVELIAIG